MQEHDIEELLRRHCQISSLELCVMHWIPEGKSLDWYLGFLQCAEVCRGIGDLFTEEKQTEAHEIIGERIREKLSKFAAKESK